MENDAEFCTVTMARVYVKQGCLEKAANIYRHLLERTPDRPDLVEALSELEEKIEAARKGRKGELIRLFRQWIELSLLRGGLESLARLRGAERGARGAWRRERGA